MPMGGVLDYDELRRWPCVSRRCFEFLNTLFVELEAETTWNARLSRAAGRSPIFFHSGPLGTFTATVYQIIPKRKYFRYDCMLPLRTVSATVYPIIPS